jgi:hypothetical protein
VAKLDAAGGALVYSTYLGGHHYNSSAAGIAVDGAGDAYVIGSTDSRDFPTTTGALSTTFAGGDTNAFVSKLDAAGSALVYSTYLGGHHHNTGAGIAVDGRATPTSPAPPTHPTSRPRPAPLYR